MSNDKKERVMTEKGFLHKSGSAKVSAAAFLAQYRGFLVSGTLASLTTPVLAKLDQGELLPTPALDQIRGIVMTHMIAKEVNKAEEAIANPPSESKPKNWTATVYDAQGQVCTRKNAKGEIEDLIKGFDTASEADRWTDRRLFEGATDSYGVVNHATMLDKHGDPLSTVILRNDSVARIMKIPRGPVMKSAPKSAGALSFRPKARNDVAHFSKG